MCQACEAQEIGRRGFLKFGAGALAVAGLGGVVRPAYAAEGEPTALTPDEALAQLKADNAAFVQNPEVCSRNLAAQREQLAGHQAPWATVVACADSRVPPELILAGAASASCSWPETPAIWLTSRHSAQSNMERLCSAPR